MEKIVNKIDKIEKSNQSISSTKQYYQLLNSNIGKTTAKILGSMTVKNPINFKNIMKDFQTNIKVTNLTGKEDKQKDIIAGKNMIQMAD